MLVSVLTVFYNREQYVKPSIESLLNQTYQNIEIIAVDDGSQDGTLKELLSFNDPRLKVYSHQNMGFVKSMIKAVELSKGEIIAIHGSGDISYDTRIEKQVSIFKENHDIGVVGCYVENENLLNGIISEHKPIINKPDQITVELLKRNKFTHGEMAFRKSIYNQVGGYRDLFKYAQDYDLWLRMSLVTKFYVIPEILYKRYTLPNGVSGSLEKLILQQNLAELSRQCLKMRIKYGYDLIDKYGVYAPFYIKRSKKFSNTLWKLSLYAMTLGEYQKAININKMSINHNITFLNTITGLLLLSCKNTEKTQKLLINLFLKIKEIKSKLQK